MKSKIKNLVEDFKLLLDSVPSLVTTFFILSVVIMNLMANKTIFQAGDWLTADAGYLLSWIPFLCMDMVTKRFGAKASIMLNIFAAVVNVACVGVFALVAKLPGNGQDFTAFNSVFSSTWFILVASMTAFTVSGVCNSLVNDAIGKLFKGTKKHKLEYACRAFTSTFVGQFLDNFLFSFIAFYTFAPKYWGWGYTLPLCLGASLFGCVIELLAEIIFSPIGYKVCKKWERDNVGSVYIEKHIV